MTIENYSTMPNVTLAHSLSFLERSDLVSVSEVSKHWKTAARDNTLWKVFLNCQNHPSPSTHSCFEVGRGVADGKRRVAYGKGVGKLVAMNIQALPALSADIVSSLIIFHGTSTISQAALTSSLLHTGLGGFAAIAEPRYRNLFDFSACIILGGLQGGLTKWLIPTHVGMAALNVGVIATLGTSLASIVGILIVTSKTGQACSLASWNFKIKCAAIAALPAILANAGLMGIIGSVAGGLWIADEMRNSMIRKELFQRSFSPGFQLTRDAWENELPVALHLATNIARSSTGYNIPSALTSLALSVIYKSCVEELIKHKERFERYCENKGEIIAQKPVVIKTCKLLSRIGKTVERVGRQSWNSWMNFVDTYQG